MRFHIGDRVRIVSEWPQDGLQNGDGLMDHWLGTEMTIRSVSSNNYKMMEDREEHSGYGWSWFEDMIEGRADEVTEAVDLPAELDTILI